jgi:non-ribosomal peptide synthetase component F
LNIWLSAEGERLRVNAPRGVLTAELKAQIAERKEELLRFLSSNRPAPLPPPIIPRTNSEPAPLSFAQERLWFLEQLAPGSAVYNVCRAYRLKGYLNVIALESSLNEIVCRHEVLRSSIRVCDNQPVQVVELPYEPRLSVIDLEEVSGLERQPEIQQRIQKIAEKPFDFTEGRFLRAQLLRLARDEHIFILATHHIVSDAWSLGILTNELWDFYAIHLDGEALPQREALIPYGDFAIWQRNWLQGEVLEKQLSYWKRQLAKLITLDLPADRPRPVHQSFYGRRAAIALPESLTSSINAFSEKYGVTPFMTLLAAFQVLLFRYSGQEDVVVGSPITNRRRTELEEVFGLFVNTLVLRSDLSGNPNFGEVIRRVREVCLGAFAHQDLPFEKLVHELQQDRDQSRNPLFQVMFAFQNATKMVARPKGLQVDPIDIDGCRSPFDLSLFLRERNGRYVGYFEYSTDLFDRDRIERMTGHFRILLQAIIANPVEPISSLPILTDSERHRIIVEWNATAADYSKTKCIHTLFEEQVDRTPNAVAVEVEGDRRTYWEINNRANQLAHYLIGLGVGPHTLVGLCLDRSFEMIVGLLGILKAGAAYVPLDPRYPKERLRFILEDTQANVLITQQKYFDICQTPPDSHKLHYLCLDRDGQNVELESTSNPNVTLTPENLAYVIYTSGSTGRPKGVCVQHRNTVNFLYWARTVYGDEELEGVLASTSVCFDLSIFEIFVPLSWGGKVVLIENLLSLIDLEHTSGITLINTVPSAMNALLSVGSLPPSVQTVNLAGEPLRRE